MRIVIDENMPLVDQLFAPFGEIVRVPGRRMDAATLADADVLLVRSVTRVDEALLAQNTRLQFVGTATIGTDHVDQAALAERGIPFFSAPGCNRISVGEYVISALLVLAERHQLSLAGMTLGIVGAGNTGSAVAERALALGMHVCLCDPPRAAAGDALDFVDLETVLACDVVSFHVPLTRDGACPTWHMLAADQIAALHGEQILINASRGDVWDNQALLQRQQGDRPLRLVMDVWEHEPQLLVPLIAHTELATPHIAGYSLEGKMRGSYMLYEAWCALHGEAPRMTLSDLLPPAAVNQVVLGANADPALVRRLVHLVYDVRRDDALFRAHYQDAASFDWLRKTYPERREWSSLTVQSHDPAPWAALGFSVTPPQAG